MLEMTWTWLVIIIILQRDKSQKLTHKLVRRISFHLVPTPRNQNRGNVENAMRILSLAKVKHKVQQVKKLIISVF